MFKQKTAYDVRISDWSSDVCSSDLGGLVEEPGHRGVEDVADRLEVVPQLPLLLGGDRRVVEGRAPVRRALVHGEARDLGCDHGDDLHPAGARADHGHPLAGAVDRRRSEEHTSELQSLMRISYAVFCLKKKT